MTVTLYRIDDCYTVIAPAGMDIHEAMGCVESETAYGYNDEERAQMRELTPDEVARFRVWLDVGGDERVDVQSYLNHMALCRDQPPFIICHDV